MKKALKGLLHSLACIVRIILLTIILVGFTIIKKLSNEKGKEKEITVRKARRIRFFYGIKRWMGRHLWVADIIGLKEHIIKVNKIWEYGV